MDWEDTWKYLKCKARRILDVDKPIVAVPYAKALFEKLKSVWKEKLKSVCNENLVLVSKSDNYVKNSF